MPVRRNPPPTFWAPAKISQPGAEPAVLDVEFKRRDRDAMPLWFASLKDMTSDQQAAESFIASWRGWIDDTGADVPYSPDEFALLCNRYHAAFGEMVAAYAKASRGEAEKN